jgi:hypothetical protein
MAYVFAVTALPLLSRLVTLKYHPNLASFCQTIKERIAAETTRPDQFVCGAFPFRAFAAVPGATAVSSSMNSTPAPAQSEFLLRRRSGHPQDHHSLQAEARLPQRPPATKPAGT